MRTKVLVLGALPQILEGPWVDLTEGIEWEVQPRGHYAELVAVQVDHEAGPLLKLDGQPVRLSGSRVRALLLDGVSELDVPSITVQIEQVA